MRSASLYIYVNLQVNRGRGLASVASDVEGRKCATPLSSPRNVILSIYLF